MYLVSFFIKKKNIVRFNIYHLIIQVKSLFFFPHKTHIFKVALHKIILCLYIMA